MKSLALLYLIAAVAAAIIGIDLGQQYTKAMLVAPGIPFEIVFTAEGKRKDLSAVSLKPVVKDKALVDAARVYGSQIGSLCTRFPHSCAANLKPLLGKSMDDLAVQDWLSTHHGVSLAPNADRNNSVLLTLGAGKHTYQFAVEELAAMSLNTIKERVLAALGSHPQALPIAEDVAVSVPPFASQLTRLAYLDTLHLANYSSILGLVDEGAAVALGYVKGMKLEPEQYNGKTVRHIVYDVGAGSTTATLFSYTPFENKTIAVDIESVGFDDTFGGDLLTRFVYDILYAKFIQQFGLDDTFAMPPKVALRLLDAAEKTKVVLSANSDYKISLESFYDDKDFKASLSRDEYEEYVSDILERVTKPILDALASRPAGALTVGDIDSIILNGGVTRTPFIQKQLTALLGEDKLAKVVNTDEACALGTTIRAYQLKMISGSSDITFQDRIFSNFEISVNDSDEQKVVFEKGSLADNSTQVSLGPVVDNKIEIGLYENGELFSTYSIPDVAKVTSELTCGENEKEVIATFQVDQNKVFKLSGLTAKCIRSPKEETETTSADNSTAPSNSTTKKVNKRQLRIGVPLAKYSVLRPFTGAEKIGSLKKLADLKAKDQEKIAFEEIKNSLESLCYALRYYIEENFEELADEVDESTLEEVSKLASEYVEWLEYESDSATIDDLKTRLAKITEHKQDYELIIKMVTTDLSMDELKKMRKEGNEIAGQVQEYLLEYGGQINELRKRYENDGFDFDAENEKILIKVHGENKEGSLELDSHYAEFKEALRALSDMIELPKLQFKKLTRQDVFETYDAVTKLIYKMMGDVMKLQELHKERIELLLIRHEKLSERKSQKAFRKKLKQEKEAQKNNGTKEELPEQEVVEDVPPTNSTASDSTEETLAHETSVAPEETASESAEEHDEL